MLFLAGYSLLLHNFSVFRNFQGFEKGIYLILGHDGKMVPIESLGFSLPISICLFGYWQMVQGVVYYKPHFGIANEVPIDLSNNPITVECNDG